MSWNKSTDDKPSAEFRDRVLRAAKLELNKLRSEQVPFWRRRMVLAGTFAAAVLALIPVLRFLRGSNGPANDEVFMTAALDHELLENSDLLNEMELLEDIDVLESWNGKES